MTRRFSQSVFGLLAVSTILLCESLSAQPRRVIHATRVNTSIPVRNMAPAVPGWRAPYAIPNKFHKFDGRAVEDMPGFFDPARQAVEGALAASILLNFEGTSDDDNAAVIGGRIVPPDTEGDVGPNHYVQWNNLVYEIFDKNGNSLVGPLPGNQFFQGLGGDCETTNDGDPVVLYDHLVDRWLVSQFAVDGPYFECVAISTTPDPTGPYHQYEFPFGNDFPDYPKLGVWPDAYYMTTRNFPGGGSFAGVQAVAFERDSMLAGLRAQAVIFDVPGGTSNDGWLPADLDGPAPPPGTAGIFAGAPSTTVQNQIELWELDVDWTTPENSTFTQIGALNTDPFDISVASVSQPRGGEALDAIPWFLMYRMQYRNFGSHEMLLLNHTVDVGDNTAGIRWYELRSGGGPWSIYQQATYALADGESRWMGSIAMNGSGDIALGYSVGSRNTAPSIRLTGQTAANSGTGIMDVAETEIIAGGGVQRSSFNRWGDYSTMSVDPSDDETFWYTNEYYPETGSFDFHTRIAVFTLTPGPVLVEATAFLEGPYIGGGLMSTALNADLPSTQPFSGSPWLYSGTETASSIPPDAVDWLLVELRSDSTSASTLARQAVLLLSDGTVVDTSGVSLPRFAGISTDSAYVAIWSRNHLPVMSDGEIEVVAGVVTHDFSSSLASVYSKGGAPLQDLGDGRFALFAGDVDADGMLADSDLSEYISQTTTGTTGYEPADLNLDSSVDALDVNLYIANRSAGAVSQVP